MPPHNITTVQITDDPETHEIEHVHKVYDKIASHFASTRYKPWPIITQFISSLPSGWVGLDSGTGNGKYLPLPTEKPAGSIWTIGLDRSRNLLQIAQTNGANGVRREVIWADVLGHGWRPGAFDYAISIATIHHLATDQRREDAVRRLLQCVSSSHGRVLIYVWAVEQDELSKRVVPDKVENQSTGQGRDVMIPWVLSKSPAAQASASAQEIPQPTVFNRYYHMFQEGELVKLVVGAAQAMGLKIGRSDDQDMLDTQLGLSIVQEGWERSNYYIELERWDRHAVN